MILFNSKYHLPQIIPLSVLLCLTIALPGNTLERPSAERLKQYELDGTLQARIEAAKKLGNHKVTNNLAAGTGYKLQRMSLSARGFSPTQIDALASPPPAWKGMPTTGTVKILVLLIEFSNYTHTDSSSTIYSKFFGDGDPSKFPLDSLRNYYRRSSYNKLEIQGNVLGWYNTQNARPVVAGAGDDATREALIKEALNYYDTQGHDFSQYDNDGDGVIDYLAVIWTGPDTGWINFWWAYKTGWSEALYLLDGRRVNNYTWQWESNPYLGSFDPQTVIHETGHMLGLPDYYDYEDLVGPKGGTGGLDMMDANSGDHNGFSKFMLDWISPDMASSGTRSAGLYAAGTSSQAVKIMPDAVQNDLFSEFFLAENRTRISTGNDKNNKGDGLLVWHVDARLDDSGNDFRYDNSYTEHKLLRLMEADGLEQIEQGIDADSGDYYTIGKSLSNTTVPDTKKYDQTPTMITLNNISASANSMTFELRVDVPPAKINDLSAQAQSDPLKILLAWTAPGEDGSQGTAGSYEIRYSTREIYKSEGFESGSLAGWENGSEWDKTKLWSATNAAHQGATGTRSAVSGAVTDGQSTWLRRKVHGPGTLSFYWKVSSETDFDFFQFSIDGTVQSKISGETYWEQKSYALTDGEHIVEWKYVKDPYESSGSDKGWVDNIVYPDNWNDSAVLASGLAAGGTAGFAESKMATALTADTGYFFRITAGDAQSNKSPVSNRASAVTLAYPPSGFAFKHVWQSSASVSWLANGNPQDTSYEIKNWTLNGSTSTVTVSAASATLTGLSGGSTTYFAARAVNKSGIPTSFDTVISTFLPNTIADFSPGTGESVKFNSASGEITFDIPSTAFFQSVQITLRQPASQTVPSPTKGLRQLASPVNVEVLTDKPLQPSQNVRVTMSYRPSDLGNTNERQLVIARYDSAHSVWVPLPSERDELADKITAWTDHFSIFQIMESSPGANLDAVTAGPNPLRPLRNPGQTVAFRNLPADGKVKIYTYAGELLRELSADVSGMALWDGKNGAGRLAASGVYLALVQGGGGKKIFKIILEK